MRRIIDRWRGSRRLQLIGAGVLLLCGVVAAASLWGKRVTQPIAFNHNLHVTKLGLECSHCHQGVETGAFATLPKAEICLRCHAAPLSDNPEEAKVRQYGEHNEIPWRRLTRVPDHVYFSHQRHVKFGGISCERCHGKMQERKRPPASAPLELSMDDCLDCHRRQEASIDCILCHR